MKKSGLFFLCVIIAIFTSSVHLNAQVSIGGNPAQPPQAPQPFSILELISVPTINVGGLRLPQLSEKDKSDINAILTADPARSKGLFIYSTANDCIEYWDGTQWVDPVSPDKLPWQISPGSPITKSAATVADSIFHTGVVSIGTKDTDPTAVLYIQADKQGVVVPRMTEEDRDNIKNPANGLVVYNTDEECFNYYSKPDTTWQSLCGKLGKAIIDSVYCSQIQVFGSYIQGVETTANERLVIPVQVQVKKIGSYDITVDAIFTDGSSNGYTFTASGTFLYEGKQTITLTAQGTPINQNFDPSNPNVGDHIRITFNGSLIDPTCNNVVIPVVPAAADYSVSCGSAVVYGVYTMAPDSTNSDDNTHYIKVAVNISNLGVGFATSGWSAETNKVSGVQFRGSGTFTGLGVDTVRLYAVAGSRATTLDPIVLNMTFQTKNGSVDCQVTMRAAYTPKKIVVFGYNSATYGYALNYGDSKNFLSSPYNFGSMSVSTVKMIDDFPNSYTDPSTGSLYTKYGAFLFRYAGAGGNINTMQNWTNIMKEKPDIVIFTYDVPDATPTVAAAIVQYLNAGGIVLQFTETSPTNIVSAVFGVPSSTLGAARYGNGSWCQLANYNDPILNGPFQPVIDGTQVKSLGGLLIFGDYESTLYGITGLPGSGIVIYAYNNQTTAGTGLGSVSAFRATGQRYCYFGEGGFFCNTNSGTYPIESGGRQPFVTTGSPEYRPAVRPFISTAVDAYYILQRTAPYQGGYNSFYFANMLAWAIDQAQFYGINSGN